MKILHVTFRYGKEAYGGAELHMRRLSEELLKKGVSVDVCTTRTNGLAPLFKSGTLWDNSLGDENIGGINVYRFPARNPFKPAALVAERILQRQLDREETTDGQAIFEYMKGSFDEKGAVLLDGWNQLERNGAATRRWTRRNASFLINDEHIRRVTLTFSNPKKIRGRLGLRSEGFDMSAPIAGGQQSVDVDIPDITGKLFADIRLQRSWSPITDHRSLGIYVSGISYEAGVPASVDMEYDYRKFFVKKGTYVDHMYGRAVARPLWYCGLFDYMRGPDSPAMRKWLKTHAGDYDVIMAQMFPFNTVKYASEAKGGRPLVVTPLMHVDDDFYHWPHYYGLLSKADAVFAMSGYSKRSLFDRLQKNTVLLGAGVDKDRFIDGRADGGAFRAKYGLEGKKLVLTVSRKSPGKRYDLLVNAVERLGKKDSDVRLVMIGPDDDHIPIRSDFVLYAGKVSDDDLVNAYDACDVFAMMSESESFGMVFCEAWSRKKPVIGSAYCGAVASLIDDGADGYLCGGVDDLAGRLEMLLDDGGLRATMGENGHRKVLENYTWDKVADRAYACYRSLGSMR